MADTTTRLVRGIVLLVGALVAVVAGWLLFLEVPGTSLARLLGVLLILGAVVAGVRVAGNVADSIAPAYNVAEVEVDDVITRDGEGGPVPFGGIGASANDIVEQIERADEDDGASGLIVTLNTPGGMVVPSEDIRRAAASFDGPTVAYAEDMAASGGYWIASGCDEFHAREGSIVGSIGVNGTQLGRKGFAEKIGLDYRQFVAGDYKDTPSPWRELSDDEVEYFQGLLDEYYEQFVDTVVDGRDLDEDLVRSTEARIFLGEEASEVGLVDHCGTREAMEERLADRLDVDEVRVREFEPERRLSERIDLGARKAAFAFGAGLASVLVGDRDAPVRLR